MEAYCGGNSLESIKVTLARTPSIDCIASRCRIEPNIVEGGKNEEGVYCMREKFKKILKIYLGLETFFRTRKTTDFP